MQRDVIQFMQRTLFKEEQKDATMENEATGVEVATLNRKVEDESWGKAT